MSASMLRLASAAIRDGARKLLTTNFSNFTRTESHLFLTNQTRCFGALANVQNSYTPILSDSIGKLLHPQTQTSVQPCRAVTKFSLSKGKRKSVKTVLKRFYRLHWGIWIRTRAGRHKHLWKKSSSQKKRAKQHVFTNSTQSWMLDKMVTKFWKRPKFWVDEPYAPYHTREEFKYTQKKPKPLPDDLL